MNTLNRLTVLLIEDDPRQLVECITQLEKLGYRVQSAASAEDGIRLAQSNPVDVILTDNILPGMTGVRSIAEYAKWSEAPVLLMTSHYSTEVEHDALLLGAKCCLKKPLDFVFLSDQLHKVLADNRTH